MAGSIDGCKGKFESGEVAGDDADTDSFCVPGIWSSALSGMTDVDDSADSDDVGAENSIEAVEDAGGIRGGTSVDVGCFFACSVMDSCGTVMGALAGGVVLYSGGDVVLSASGRRGSAFLIEGGEAEKGVLAGVL